MNRLFLRLASRRIFSLRILPSRLLWTIVVCAVLSCGFSGCHLLTRFHAPLPKPPVAFQAPPNQQDLIQQVQRNTQAVRQLQADVSVTMDDVWNARGTLVLERPQRLRLKIGAVAVPILDVGSNDEHFWIYNQTSLGGQTPALYFARHREFANSPLQQSLPLRPQWIMDALGLIEFTPDQNLEGPFPRQDGRVELRSTLQTAQGPMTRVTVIDPQYGWVVQQSVYHANHKLVVYANSTKYRYFPEQQVSIPQYIELHIFDPTGQEMEVTLRLSNIRLNAFYGDPAQAWQMPTPTNVPQVDLTQVNLQAQQGIPSSPSSSGQAWYPPGSTPTAPPSSQRTAKTPWRPQIRGLGSF